MSANPAFPQFRKFAPEVQCMIFGFMNNYDMESDGTTIAVKVKREPNFHCTDPAFQQPGQIYYRFSVEYHLEGNMVAPRPIFPNYQARHHYELRFPSTLGLNDRITGERFVRFHPARDTIFFSLDSLFTLYDYARPINPMAGEEGPGFGPLSVTRRANITGFNQIQKLATSMANPDVPGMRYLRQEIFTGLRMPISTNTSFLETLNYNTRLNSPLQRWNFPVLPGALAPSDADKAAAAQCQLVIFNLEFILTLYVQNVYNIGGFAPWSSAVGCTFANMARHLTDARLFFQL